MSDPFTYTFPSPLEGIDTSTPLPNELNEDGKSFKNPPAGRLSEAYDHFTDGLSNGRRGGFDVHVYYFHADEKQTAYAKELWERIRREFPELRIYKVWDKPIGPHSMAMFEVNIFTPAQFGAFIPWLVINRGPLSALLHPNTGESDDDESEEYRNHTQRATWLGQPVPLNTAIISPQDFGANLAPEHEEQLRKVDPVLEDQSRQQSPPTNNVFVFPSLLECLFDQSPPGYSNMPHRDCLLDLEDDLTSISSLQRDEQSDTISVASGKLTADEEINKAILQEEFDAEDVDCVDSYSIDDLLSEALSHYGDRKPEFCVNAPQNTTKSMRLPNGNDEVEIRFENWNTKVGYWVLTDNAGDEHIIKCRGKKYYIWEGVTTGFSKEVAGHTSNFKQEDEFRLQEVSSQSTSYRASTLRSRSIAQTMPYTLYSAQKKFENQGVRLSTTELEKMVQSGTTATLETASRPSKKRKLNKSVSDSSCVESGSWSGECDSSISPSIEISDEHLLNNTILRTRFHGFAGGSIPLLAHTCSSNDVFFAVIRTRWAFQLAGQQIEYCIASFPWLTSEKNVVMQEGDEESFKAVLEEVRNASGWGTSGKMEIVIEIYSVRTD